MVLELVLNARYACAYPRTLWVSSGVLTLGRQGSEGWRLRWPRTRSARGRMLDSCQMRCYSTLHGSHFTLPRHARSWKCGAPPTTGSERRELGKNYTHTKALYRYAAYGQTLPLCRFKQAYAHTHGRLPFSFFGPSLHCAHATKRRPIYQENEVREGEGEKKRWRTTDDRLVGSCAGHRPIESPHLIITASIVPGRF